MKLQGFRVNERIQRVINKLFDRELDLDEIFLDRGDTDDEDENRPSKFKILKQAMLNIDELCALSSEVTTENVEMPLIDEIQDSDDDLPWKESKR
jgi:hypothetical protein